MIRINELVSYVATLADAEHEARTPGYYFTDYCGLYAGPYSTVHAAEKARREHYVWLDTCYAQAEAQNAADEYIDNLMAQSHGTNL